MINPHSEANRVAMHWFYWAMVWFPALTTFGLILAIKFFNPTFLGAEAFLTFGRIRPAHVNGVLFGFVSSGLLGTMFYITPRLCGRPLWKPIIGKVAAHIWNFSFLFGILFILAGNTQAREYTEIPFAFDVGIVIALILNAIVILGTIIKRKEHKLYVSLWFFGALVIWFPLVYIIGNVMWNPPSGALIGAADAVNNWYYGHNVLGLWFTPLGIGAWYYFIIRLIKKPLTSHLLSLISFFALAFFYTGLGAHHLIQSPLPEYYKTIAIIYSTGMIFSVAAFATNIGMSLRGAWHKIFSNVPLRFMVIGFVNYLLVSLQGTFQAYRDLNVYLHYGQWVVSHSHLSILGAFGFEVMGLMFWLVPRITGKKLFSKKMMNVTFWVAFWGFTLFMIGMVLAGLVQGSNWFSHLGVHQFLPSLAPYYQLRAIGGGMVVLGAFLFAINMIATLFSKPAPKEIQKEMRRSYD